MNTSFRALALPGMLALLVTAAQAQTIERLKITDGDLNCQQIYTEIKLMEATVAQSTPQAAAAPAESNAGSQVAGAVAQQAMAQVAARSGFGGMLGGAGGLGGMLGSLAQAATAAPAPAAAPAGNPMLAQQAAARKEHLTSLFLGKSCRTKDVK